jgi:signal transduction histidine kinase
MMSTDDTKPFPYPAFSYCDPQGVLWLTDNKGKHLYAYSDGSRNAKMSSLAYPLMDYSIRTMLRTGNKIWMGGDRGICVIDQTQQDPTKLIKPHVQIRSVEILDSVVWGGFGTMPEMLPELDNSFHRITINYSINYPSLLMRTQYRYRLNGGNWTAWDNDRFEEFPNLPSGSYTFEVQARDAHGQISDSASISFIIKQPWYWRWYMILLYLVLAAAVSYLFIIWRTQRLEKEKHRLESLVKERTDEVVKLEKVAAVGKLTQGLIDRILNPLNYINNFAKLSEGLVNDVRANIEDEQENMDPENYEDTIDVLDMLKGNLQKVGEHGASTSRTLKAMEEMLKDRSGGIIKMNLTPLLHQNEEMVKKYFEKQIAEYHISTVFDLPNHDVFINGNAEQLSKTFMNILGNALYAVIKQTKRHEGGEPYTPEIKFRAAMSDKHIQLYIRDNGIGIEHTIIDKIFDPFFTTKTTGEATGVGLYLCREIIQNHGGDITAKSEKHVYTEFTITLPTL